MTKEIKLFWDFRGPASAGTAEHFEKHLRHYLAEQGEDALLTGFQVVSEAHAYSYVIIPRELLERIKRDLKPHRGELYAQD